MGCFLSLFYIRLNLLWSLNVFKLIFNQKCGKFCATFPTFCEKHHFCLMMMLRETSSQNIIREKLLFLLRYLSLMWILAKYWYVIMKSLPSWIRKSSHHYSQICKALRWPTKWTSGGQTLYIPPKGEKWIL